MIENPLSEYIAEPYRSEPTLRPSCFAAEAYWLEDLASALADGRKIPVTQRIIHGTTAQVIQKTHHNPTELVLDSNDIHLQGLIIFEEKPLRTIYARAKYDTGHADAYQDELKTQLDAIGLPTPGNTHTTLDVLMTLLSKLHLPVGTNFATSIHTYSSWLESSGIAQEEWWV